MMFGDDEPAREVEAPTEVEAEAAIAADLSRACISPGVSLSSSTADIKAQESPGQSPSWTSSCSSGGTSKPDGATTGLTSSGSSLTRRVRVSSRRLPLPCALLLPPPRAQRDSQPR